MVDSVTEIERAAFWTKVVVGDLDECWQWTAHVNHRGYGRIGIGAPKRIRKATHVALLLDGRPRPAPHLIALHSCDNPSCVNPLHLRWGTHGENAADKIARGRARPQRGSDSPLAKLGEEAVRAIRAARGFQKDIAKEFGVCQMSVSLIKRRKVWAHLDD